MGTHAITEGPDCSILLYFSGAFSKQPFYIFTDCTQIGTGFPLLNLFHSTHPITAWPNNCMVGLLPSVHNPIKLTHSSDWTEDIRGQNDVAAPQLDKCWLKVKLY